MMLVRLDDSNEFCRIRDEEARSKGMLWARHRTDRSAEAYITEE